MTTLLYSSLLAVSRITSGNGRPHQSTISSNHLLGGLPLCRSSSTMPSMIVFISFLSGIRQRHIWPNNCSFLCFIMSTTVKFLCTLSLMLLATAYSQSYQYHLFFFISLFLCTQNVSTDIEPILTRDTLTYAHSRRVVPFGG